MSRAPRALAATVAWVALSISARGARAMDCPCTWQEVICDADAVAEVEMILATKASPDRMEVRRVIWNRTKHPIRPSYGHPNILHVTKTRDDLLQYLPWYRKSGPRTGPVPEWVGRYQRALDRGSYRTIIFVDHYRDGPWSGGGVVFTGEEWLDHPNHGAWWARIERLLDERIEADKRHQVLPVCEPYERQRARAGLPPRYRLTAGKSGSKTPPPRLPTAGPVWKGR